MKTSKEIYGQSMAFPPRVGPDGHIQWSSGPANIRESVEIILKTELQERLYLPEFGTGLRTFLFEPNTTATRAQIEDRIAKSLSTWEPRVSVVSVDVDEDPEDPAAAIARVEYKLVATRTQERISVRVPLAT